MIWYTWRQSRIVLLSLLVITSGVALTLVIVGMRLNQDLHSLQNPACQNSDICHNIVNDLVGNQTLFAMVSMGLIALPALMGIFIGVPMVAREYEQRTYQFIFTQGITRRRWLVVQIGMLFGGVIVLTSLLSLLVNWGVSTTFVPIPNTIMAMSTSERFSVWGFDLSGTVPVAYAIFALALGLASGTFLRRTLPALAVTLFGYVAVRLPVALFARPHYLPPILQAADVRDGFPANSLAGPFAWILEQGDQRNGLRYPQGLPIPIDCRNAAGGQPLPQGGSATPNMTVLTQCLHDHGWSLYTLYQPYDRFWLFQGIETAIFLALAAGLVAATFAMVLRRPR